MSLRKYEQVDKDKTSEVGLLSLVVQYKNIKTFQKYKNLNWCLENSEIQPLLNETKYVKFYGIKNLKKQFKKFFF